MPHARSPGRLYRSDTATGLCPPTDQLPVQGWDRGIFRKMYGDAIVPRRRRRSRPSSPRRGGGDRGTHPAEPDDVRWIKRIKLNSPRRIHYGGVSWARVIIVVRTVGFGPCSTNPKTRDSAPAKPLAAQPVVQLQSPSGSACQPARTRPAMTAGRGPMPWTLLPGRFARPAKPRRTIDRGH
jgi:hypothetical protein